MSREPIQLQYSGPARGPGAFAAEQVRGNWRDWLGWIGGKIGWGAVALFLLLVVMGVAFAMAGVTLYFMALVIFAWGTVLLKLAARSVRRRRAAAVLGYLNQAVKLNLPLPRLMLSAARSERGRLHRRLLALHEQLSLGAPIADALSHTVPEMPSRALGLIHFAEQTGRLPETLEQLTEETAAPVNTRDHSFLVVYPIFALVVTSVVMIFAMPKLQMILSDFHLPMPHLTRMLLSIARNEDLLLLLTMATPLMLLWFLASQLRNAFRVRPARCLLWPVTDWIIWHTPIVGDLARSRGLADVCSVLADAIKQGRPLGEPLMRLQQLDLNRVLRKRLNRWAILHEEGLPLPDAARQAKLPRFLVGLLIPSTDPAAALRFASRYYALRHQARREAMLNLALPLVTVVMGIFVAIVALSIMLPMRDLIDALGKSWRHL